MAVEAEELNVGDLTGRDLVVEPDPVQPSSFVLTTTVDMVDGQRHIDIESASNTLASERFDSSLSCRSPAATLTGAGVLTYLISVAGLPFVDVGPLALVVAGLAVTALWQPWRGRTLNAEFLIGHDREPYCPVGA